MANNPTCLFGFVAAQLADEPRSVWDEGTQAIEMICHSLAMAAYEVCGHLVVADTS